LGRDLQNPRGGSAAQPGAAETLISQPVRFIKQQAVFFRIHHYKEGAVSKEPQTTKSQPWKRMALCCIIEVWTDNYYKRVIARCQRRAEATAAANLADVQDITNYDSTKIGGREVPNAEIYRKNPAFVPILFFQADGFQPL